MIYYNITANFTQQKNTIVLAATYFPRAQAQVSSALEGLTSEFGMGSGVTPPLKTTRTMVSFI